jgi:hypothetical protein
MGDAGQPGATYTAHPEIGPCERTEHGPMVDGSHRYVAGRLVGKEPVQVPGVLSPIQIEKTQPVQNLGIDPSDQGDR